MSLCLIDPRHGGKELATRKGQCVQTKPINQSPETCWLSQPEAQESRGPAGQKTYRQQLPCPSQHHRTHCSHTPNPALSLSQASSLCSSPGNPPVHQHQPVQRGCVEGPLPHWGPGMMCSPGEHWNPFLGPTTHPLSVEMPQSGLYHPHSPPHPTGVMSEQVWPNTNLSTAQR